MKKSGHVRAVLALFIAAMVPCGCGGSSGSSVRVQGMTITMAPPEGWQQGEVKSPAGYRPGGGGRFFFADAEKDFPSAEVTVIDLLGDSLSEYVRKSYKEEKALQATAGQLMGMLSDAAEQLGASEAGGEAGKAGEAAKGAGITTREFMIGPQQAAEILLKGEGVRLWVFVAKGDKAAMIVFEAERSDFEREEARIRASIETIRVK